MEATAAADHQSVHFPRRTRKFSHSLHAASCDSTNCIGWQHYPISESFHQSQLGSSTMLLSPSQVRLGSTHNQGAYTASCSPNRSSGQCESKKEAACSCRCSARSSHFSRKAFHWEVSLRSCAPVETELTGTRAKETSRTATRPCRW